MTRRFIVDLIDSDETDRFVSKYGADEITNMTNGDVIKALFPDNDYIENLQDTIGVDFRYKTTHASMSYFTDIGKDWWNAPYKPESEVEE